VNQQTLQPYVGKFVIIDLIYPSGRVDPLLKGVVLSCGSGGFIVEGENFCWPTSIRYSELKIIRLDPSRDAFEALMAQAAVDHKAELARAAWERQ
jgi:hypothetical protein